MNITIAFAFILAAMHWYIAEHHYNGIVRAVSYIAAIVWLINGAVNIFSMLY